MNANNNASTPAAKLPTALVWAITLVAASVAIAEALASYFVAIRASRLNLRGKLAHGVAAVWVTLSRARAGLRAIRQTA